MVSFADKCGHAERSVKCMTHITIIPMHDTDSVTVGTSVTVGLSVSLSECIICIK